MRDRARARQPGPLTRLLATAGAGLLVAACGAFPPKTPTAPAATPSPGGKPGPAAPAPEPASPLAVTPEAGPAPLPEIFESDEFIVTFAKAGETAERLAEKLLGDPTKAWVIEDYNGTASFSPGQEVVIPKRSWNLAAVDPSGYQIVPVLVYHNIGPEAKGRLVLAAQTFEEQMRYLKAQGYRVVSLSELYDFMSFKRQLPRRAVVITFDDGYKSFLQYAYPLLKELGFMATLFVYTDYVGAGRNALSWEDLRRLALEGFDVQAHSKTHGDLRRKPGESDEEYGRRMQLELGYPQTLFQRYLGRSARILAYPYGYHDESLMQRAREFGYTAAFTVRREGNPAFVYPLSAHRSQIYADMSLADFVKNLTIFSQEPAR